jgi:hypothetical protein
MAATTDLNATRDPGARSATSTVARLATETKAAFKTTELYAYVVVLVGILVAAAVTKAGSGHDDRFISKQAWLYVTVLTVGYMISRGLAKSGSREPYTDDRDRH